MNGICVWCGQTAKLVKSHIIPRSLCRPIIESEGVAHLYSTEVAYRRKSRTGIYDHMICEKCERLFQDWDDYAARFFLTELPSHQIERYEPDLLHAAKSINLIDDVSRYVGRRTIENYDYGKLKLFLLSLLWRANLTTHDFFDAVDLGPHENKISSMLRTADPGDWNCYSCVLHGFDDNEAARVSFSPHRVKVAGITAYRFLVAGYSALIKVDKREFGDPYSRYALRPGHILRIPIFEWRQSKELQAILKAVSKMPPTPSS